MNKQEITRAILQTTIRRYLADIRSDPDRSMRNLIDLGMNFSKGRFQKRFFDTARKMLENEKSPYYTLVKNTVAAVDQERLQTFGINLGYNSCTYGAGIIRENEAAFGFNIPWSILFSVTGEPDTINADDLSHVISEGRELGIYTYLIFSRETDPFALADLFEEYSDCAFLLFVIPATVGEREADALAVYRNLMVVVDAGETGFSHTAELLGERRMLFGASLPYSDADFATVLSGAWMEAADTVPYYPFTFFLPAAGASAATRAAVQEYVQQTRGEQRYPHIPLELYGDLLCIDTVVSDDACCILFDSAGDGWSFEKKLAYNLREMPLRMLLERTMPRKK